MKMNDVGMVIPAKTEINIDALSIEELTALIQKCSDRRCHLQTQERNKAYGEFVAAYRRFREISPVEQKFRTIEAETYSGHTEDIEIDIFDVLDEMFG